MHTCSRRYTPPYKRPYQGLSPPSPPPSLTCMEIDSASTTSRRRGRGRPRLFPAICRPGIHDPIRILPSSPIEHRRDRSSCRPQLVRDTIVAVLAAVAFLDFPLQPLHLEMFPAAIRIRVSGLGVRVQGLGLRGCRSSGLGFGVKGLEFKVYKTHAHGLHALNIPVLQCELNAMCCRVECMR